MEKGNFIYRSVKVNCIFESLGPAFSWCNFILIMLTNRKSKKKKKQKVNKYCAQGSHSLM